MLQNKRKRKVTDEYVRRVKKISKSKLNDSNFIKGINSWAIDIVRYGAGILNWKKEELRVLDRETRLASRFSHQLIVRYPIHEFCH